MALPETQVPESGQTEVNSYDVSSVNQGVGDYSNILTKDDLGYLMTSLKESMVPPKNTTLPPDYYYPSRGTNVIRGQMSTPLGSMALISPGAPLFPYSVMDAVDAENRAASAAMFKEAMKPLIPKDIKVSLLDNTAWNRGWVSYQHNGFNDIVSDYLDKSSGDPITARMLMERDGALQKKADEFAAMKSSIDTTEALASEILSPDGDNKTYTSKMSYDLAREWREAINAVDFDDENSWRYIDGIKSRLNKSLGLDVAAATLVDGITNTVIMDDVFREVAYESGGDEKKMKTSIDQVFANYKNGGLAAITDTNRLEDMIRKEYDAKYPAKSDTDPTFEEFKNHVMSVTPSVVDQTFQHLRSSDAWNQAYANWRVNQKTLSPTEQWLDINGKKIKTRVFQSPDAVMSYVMPSSANKDFFDNDISMYRNKPGYITAERRYNVDNDPNKQEVIYYQWSPADSNGEYDPSAPSIPIMSTGGAQNAFEQGLFDNKIIRDNSVYTVSPTANPAGGGQTWTSSGYPAKQK